MKDYKKSSRINKLNFVTYAVEKRLVVSISFLMYGTIYSMALEKK